MDEAARKRLWIDYARTKRDDLREKLILEYAPLVKLVAGRLNMYLGNNVEFDDLVGYGIFGLIDAIDKFDAFKDVKFETYASLRIRGSILDQIRKMDWIPRTIRQRQRQIDQVCNKIQAEKGRDATDEEIAEGLGITGDEYLEWQTQMKVTGVVSLNEYLETGSDIPNESASRVSEDFQQPEAVLEKAELKAKLIEALELLTDKEKTVITLYYYEEMTLKEISSVLEVSESRVSQLHTRALSKMKTKMGAYMGILHSKA
ncbi:MAG: FliA/WhiG family RNA polymerase sigma factor [Lachnospiraceae bacterium]|nr:FliA/WhiG family RNA polymerase sigma factor [Lachnospiraceae bacterium]